jgi:hypothetical protein
MMAASAAACGSQRRNHVRPAWIASLLELSVSSTCHTVGACLLSVRTEHTQHRVSATES